MDVWKDLEPLRTNRDVGPEIITFGVLWQFAGGRMRRLDVTVKAIAEEFDRDGSTLREQLEKLFRLGVVHLLARDKRRGRFLINVLHPSFGLVKRKKSDAEQLRLPLEWAEGVGDIDEFIQVTFGDSGEAEIMRIGPTEEDATRQTTFGDTAKVQIDRVGSVDQQESNLRKPADDTIVVGCDSSGASDGDAANTSPAVANTSVEAGENSGVASFAGKPEERTVRSSVTNATLAAGKTPPASAKAVSPAKTGPNVPRGFPGENPAGNSPGKPSRIVNVNEEMKSPLNGLTNNENNVNVNAVAAQPALQRRGADLPPPDPLTARLDMGDLCGQLVAAADPARQKTQLMHKLRGLILDRDTTNWLIGFAADVMLIHGQRNLRVYDQMNAFLQDMAAFREGEKRAGKIPAPLGKWLNKRVHDICEENGIETPRSKKAAKQRV